MNLFPTSFQRLENALNVSSLKQRVISSNISNVDTPGYKSQQVAFKEALDSAMGGQTLKANRTNEKHLPFQNEVDGAGPGAKIISRPNTNFNHNGNNVDIDYEMAEMAKNQLLYNTLIERTNGKFNSLRSVISGN
ncbi:flagellar basal body rod protein FlgB [Niallia taxi]|uniref:flagellar basal body rod protein FlgB n=1 Tax=Niallia taxi TaxID=2499688 RepID=UPI0015F3A97F|nr:flagellar basal body rod protein FlgB [Niallia taxi]